MEFGIKKIKEKIYKIKSLHNEVNDLRNAIYMSTFGEIEEIEIEEHIKSHNLEE